MRSHPPEQPPLLRPLRPSGPPSPAWPSPWPTVWSAARASFFDTSSRRSGKRCRYASSVQGPNPPGMGCFARMGSETRQTEVASRAGSEVSWHSIRPPALPSGFDRGRQRCAVFRGLRGVQVRSRPASCGNLPRKGKGRGGVTPPPLPRRPSAVRCASFDAAASGCGRRTVEVPRASDERHGPADSP
jgi:hypothetical protein